MKSVLSFGWLELLGQRIDKSLAPVDDVTLLDLCEQPAPAILALIQRHGQRPVQRVGDRLDVVRVDDQRPIQLAAAPAKRDSTSTPGSSAVLGRDILLRPPGSCRRASGVTRPTRASAVEAGQSVRRESARLM